MAEVERVGEIMTVLGESPVWHAAEQSLYLVDIMKPAVIRYRPSDEDMKSWKMPSLIGSIGLRGTGGLIAGLQSGFAFIDVHAGKLSPITDPEPDKPDNRLNDGKCDRAGRFWCGSMNVDRAPGAGALYRLDSDHTCHKVDSGITVPNGLAWNPENTVMYFADSGASKVYAYDYNLATGAIENRRVFIDLADQPARVDGATVDRDGYYWCAHIDDWAVAKYDPNGKLVETIALPVQYPTMCAFGGEALDTLYVTSLTTLVKPHLRNRQPLAGAVFAIHDTGAVGIPESPFLG